MCFNVDTDEEESIYIFHSNGYLTFNAEGFVESGETYVTFMASPTPSKNKEVLTKLRDWCNEQLESYT